MFSITIIIQNMHRSPTRMMFKDSAMHHMFQIWIDFLFTKWPWVNFKTRKTTSNKDNDSLILLDITYLNFKSTFHMLAHITYSNCKSTLGQFQLAPFNTHTPMLPQPHMLFCLLSYASNIQITNQPLANFK